MTLRSGLRGVGLYLAVILGGFLTAYLVVALVVFPSGATPRDVRVPAVVGLQFDDAVRQLATRGLHGVRAQERNHDAAPRGTVLEQNPVPGSRDVAGATVELAVSVGPSRDSAAGAVAPDTGRRP